MRLFAAIDLPEHITEAIRDWRERGGLVDSRYWRATPPQSWHLTLAFFGEMRSAEIDPLAEMLVECAEMYAPVCLNSDRCGYFPRPSRARVFWVGIEQSDGGDQLRHLARCCRRAGHATVRRRTARESAFRAHITIARALGHAAAPAVDPEVEPPALSWCADRFSLYQSILRPEGAQYRRLETFELNGPR